MARVLAALIAGAAIGVAVLFFLRTEAPIPSVARPAGAPEEAAVERRAPVSRTFVSPTHPGLVVSVTRAGVSEPQARIDLSRAERSIASGQLVWRPAGMETTNADGRAEFPALAGRYYVGVVAFDGTRALELVDVSWGDGPTFVTVNLKAASSFSGQVVDKVSRKPLSGALVRADPQPAPEELDATFAVASTVADSLGRFALDLPAQRWRLEARAPGYLAQSLEVKEPSKELALELVRGVALSGLVVDVAGEPVADVIVRLTPGDVTSLSSDREGRFLVTVPHEPISLHGLAPDGRQGLARLTLQARQETAQVRLVVADGSELSGVVRDTEGPVGHADVRIFAEPESLEVAAFDTAPDGRFAAKGLPPGRYSVRAQQGLGRRANAVGLELPGAQPLELVLSASGRLVGVVQDAEGHPAEGAEVTLSWPRGLREVARTARTGASGQFEFEDLLPAQVTVQARYSDLVSEEAETYVAPGATAELTLTTAPQGRLVGTVVGQRIDRVLVRVDRAGGEFINVDQTAQRFEKSLAPGTYRLFAEVGGGAGQAYRFFERQTAEVRAGEITTVVLDVGELADASAAPIHNFKMHPELGSGLSFENSPGGVRVDFLMSDCPAAKAGVQLGDLVVAIDGEATRDALDAFARVRKPSDGTTMDFLVRRQGQDLELTLR